MRAAWRAATVALAGAAFLAVPAGQADAHTRTQETTNVVSRIVADPGLDGIEWTVHTGGLLVEVVNRTDRTVVIEGYEGEPYLRIGPAGVERNRRSPATYLNQERFRRTTMPPDVDAAAEPEWIAVDDDPRYVWHDHRTHWMSTAPPRFVEAGPVTQAAMRAELVGAIGTAGEDAGVFQTWTIPFSVDDAGYEVTGEMAWEDPPGAWPWLLLSGLLVVPALIGIRRVGTAAMVRPAALVVGLVGVLNMLHLVDDLGAWPSDPLDELFGLLHTSIFLTAGIGCAVWAYRVSYGRVLALGLASGAVLYHQGLVHLPMLFASQFPTVWPDGLVRLSIALGLLQAIPVAVVVIRARRVPTTGTATGPARGEPVVPVAVSSARAGETTSLPG